MWDLIVLIRDHCLSIYFGSNKTGLSPHVLSCDYVTSIIKRCNYISNSLRLITSFNIFALAFLCQQIWEEETLHKT